MICKGSEKKNQIKNEINSIENKIFIYYRGWYIMFCKGAVNIEIFFRQSIQTERCSN